MRARILIADAAYGLEARQQLSKAFEDAWDIIAPSVADDPPAIRAARMSLANIILGLANNGSIDPEQLTDAAVSLMAHPNKTHPDV